MEDYEWESNVNLPPYEPEIFVFLPCRNAMIEESKVQFEGISEDTQGRDILEFRCPYCGNVHESLRLG